jgi:predicted secreted protein
MATYKGSDGIVKVGTNTVAEIRSYSIEETADTLEDTSMGDGARTYKPSLTSFSGSLDVFWDESDSSGQGALSIGAEVQLNVYPEGADTNDVYYQGDVIVTGVSRSASFDGLVEASISVQGTGALSELTA